MFADIVFFAQLLLSTILLEAGNREPDPICTGLTSLLVEKGSKRVLLRKLSTRVLQVSIANAALIHPLAQALGSRMNCTVLIASSMARLWT
jgi:hypothetical protein